MRLWLQYAGIALVALAYLGGLIGWSYASLNLEKNAASAPTQERLHIVKVGLAGDEHPAGLPFP